jgi:hypothetical protein
MLFPINQEKMIAGLWKYRQYIGGINTKTVIVLTFFALLS